MQEDGNGNLIKVVKTLKMVAPNVWRGPQYKSEDYDGKKQFAINRRQAVVTSNGFFSDTHKVAAATSNGPQSDWKNFDPQPYLLLDPKAPEKPETPVTPQEPQTPQAPEVKTPEARPSKTIVKESNPKTSDIGLGGLTASLAAGISGLYLIRKKKEDESEM